MKTRYRFVIFCFGFVSFGGYAGCGAWDVSIAPKQLIGQCYDKINLVAQGRNKRVIQARYQLMPTTRLPEPVTSLWQEKSATSTQTDWVENENDDYTVLFHRGLLQNLESESLAFTVPLATSVSRKLLPSMETYEVQSAAIKGPITVVSGVIGENQVKAVYKILIHQDSMAHIAFIFPNLNSLSVDLSDYVTTVHCIEVLTGHSVVRNPTRFSDWKYSLSYDLNIWTQGGSVLAHECPHEVIKSS